MTVTDLEFEYHWHVDGHSLNTILEVPLLHAGSCQIYFYYQLQAKTIRKNIKITACAYTCIYVPVTLSLSRLLIFVGGVYFLPKPTHNNIRTCTCI